MSRQHRFHGPPGSGPGSIPIQSTSGTRPPRVASWQAGSHVAGFRNLQGPFQKRVEQRKRRWSQDNSPSVGTKKAREAEKTDSAIPVTTGAPVPTSQLQVRPTSEQTSTHSRAIMQLGEVRLVPQWALQLRPPTPPPPRSHRHRYGSARGYSHNFRGPLPQPGYPRFCGSSNFLRMPVPMAFTPPTHRQPIPLPPPPQMRPNLWWRQQHYRRY